MKKIFMLLIVANLFVDMVSYFLLPDSIAVHFAAGGRPNGWFSATGNLVFSLGMQGTFAFIVYALRTTLPHVPKQLVNLPNKNYWLAEENLPEFKVRWDALTYQFGSGLMAFFLTMSLIILHANFSSPTLLNTKIFVAAMLGFLLFLIYWIISLYRNLRLPE